MNRFSLFLSCPFLFAASLALGAQQPDAYNPLALPEGRRPRPINLVARDQARERDVPLRVFLPATTKPAPVLLVSHGLGGSREGSAYLGEHWAARGFVVVYLQHPGSDASVWKDKPRAEAREDMVEAASGANLRLRVLDVKTVMDRLTTWHTTEGHALAGRLDLKSIGMSGHSFGAVTSQAVGGQTFPILGRRWSDPRLRAVLALSPSPPRSGDPAVAFKDVAIPWMLMTGTRDAAAIGGITAADRLEVFPHLPKGGKYELVLEGALHSAFSDRALPGDTGTRNPNHHRAILALSTAFWDAHLRGDAGARAWLEGAGPRTIIEKADQWRMK